jgi:hypothetical protein
MPQSCYFINKIKSFDAVLYIKVNYFFKEMITFLDNLICNTILVNLHTKPSGPTAEYRRVQSKQKKF